MRNRWTVWALSLIALGCGGPDSGTRGDASTNEETVTGRYPTGTFLLSQDTKYEKACNTFGESFIASMFGVEETTKITTVQNQTGCDFVWNNKKQVSLSTTNIKPFQSIYQAEFYFDSLYQPTVFRQNRRPHHPAYTGPYTEDNQAEGPTEGMANHSSRGSGQDSSAVNDSSSSITGGTSSALQLTQGAVNSAAGRAIQGVGDKAIWDDKSRTLHVLYLHHVIHIMVNHGPTPAEDLSHASRLAMVWIDKMSEESEGGIETPPGNPVYR